MARYIRTDELLATARDGYHSDFGRSMADLTSLREVIEDTPTADVVEVVRCKDCKHFMEYSEEYHGKVESADGDCYLRFINSVDKQFQAVCCNDFCSCGKRKEGD